MSKNKDYSPDEKKEFIDDLFNKGIPVEYILRLDLTNKENLSNSIKELNRYINTIENSVNNFLKERW
ncbi:hypothetical protein [Clostridium celatum]|nr:hypothetical protein [Clostridium celatum]MCE9653891.1 hypothetical protein [Clostridium celatum]